MIHGGSNVQPELTHVGQTREMPSMMTAESTFGCIT